MIKCDVRHQFRAFSLAMVESDTKLILLWNMKIYIVTIRDFCIVHLHNVGTLLPQIVKAFSHISREIYPFLLNLGKGCNLRTMACISVKYDLLLLILVSELKEGNAVKYQISLA